jgi:hypothetical protein
MSKKIIYLAVFISALCLAGVALAQSGSVSIPNPLNGVNSFGDLLSKIVVGVRTLIASLGTIMIIVAGILYLTSAGSPEKIKTAKTALIYAIVGIAMGIAADAIVSIIKGIIGAGS